MSIYWRSCAWCARNSWGENAVDFERFCFLVGETREWEAGCRRRCLLHRFGKTMSWNTYCTIIFTRRVSLFIVVSFRHVKKWATNKDLTENQQKNYRAHRSRWWSVKLVTQPQLVPIRLRHSSLNWCHRHVIRPSNRQWPFFCARSIEDLRVIKYTRLNSYSNNLKWPQLFLFFIFFFAFSNKKNWQFSVCHDYLTTHVEPSNCL